MRLFITGAAGFIGGSIAKSLAEEGHTVIGLIRDPQQAEALQTLGITPIVGSLDDSQLLKEQSQAADAVINAASSDHLGAVQAIIEGLKGSNKVFLHTSGSSIVGDASGGLGTDNIFYEDKLPAPTEDKAARVALDNTVIEAAKQGIRSSVMCNTLIYGHGRSFRRDSVQLPRLLKQAQKSGIARHVGPGENIWSNVHIDDVVQAYKLALTKTQAGNFYFLESGEARFRDMSNAIAKVLHLESAQDWPLDQAKQEWGYEMASYALGSNSRVRGHKAKDVLGWEPKHTDVIEWITTDMMK